MPDFVQTAPYDPSAGGVIRNEWRKWATTNDLLYVCLRGIRWVVVHPITWPGIVASGWLLSKGVPIWAVLPVLFAIPIWRADKSQVWVFGSALRSRSLTQGRNTLSNWWRIRRGWSTGARAAGFVQSGRGGRVPRLRHWEQTNSGISAVVTCGVFGWTADELAAKSASIAAGVKKCRMVTVTQGEFPGVARLDFAFTDPLAETLSVADLAAAPKARLTCGLTERGDPAHLHNYLSTLVVGLPGSGKSNMLWTLILSALASGEPFELWVLDPAGGVELWELSNGSPLVRDYAATPAEMKRLVHDLHTKMIQRMETMAGKERLHIPTKEAPRWYLVIDEAMRAYHQLKKNGGTNGKGNGNGGPNHQQLLVEILSLGRKAAITTIALTQIPFAHAIGEQVRLLFPQKVVFRSNDWLVTNTAFGSGSEALGAAASKISIRTPGVGYMITDNETRPTRFRTPFISDFMTTLIAKGILPDGIPKVGDVGQSWHNNEHVLYRWDNATRNPVCRYVGISVSGVRRADQHLSNDAKAELREPGVTMTIVERFNVDTHADEVAAGRTVKQIAEAVEKQMIQELAPPLNIAHNGTRRRRKAIES